MEELRAQLGLVILLQCIQIINWLAVFWYLLRDRKTGPSIPQLYDKTVRAVRASWRRKYAKDLQPLPQLFDEAGFRAFCRELLDAVKHADSMGDVKLTEDEWKRRGYSRKQFIAYRDKLEEKGIICKVDERGTRGWRTTESGSYGWARGRLEKLAKT